MRSLTVVIIASAVGLLLAAGSSFAATGTSTIQVSATTVDACSVTTTDVNFGLYDPGADRDAEGSITVTCTDGVTYSIGLGDGNYPSVLEPLVRRMWDPNSPTGVSTSYLVYGLFKDSGRSTGWGDGGNAPGGDMAGLLGDGTAQIYPVYGRIPAGQYSTPSTAYSDLVQVAIKW